jgi:branched-chain amino acid transport system substrate-binding protein
MKMKRREFMAGAAAGVAIAGAPAIVRAQGATIKIGEVNSYTAIPAFTVPYRQGWQLAVEEINAAGGVIGRKLEVISRDDAGKPEDAVRIAGELVNNEKVALLAGTFLSHVGLAVSAFAKQNKVYFMAAEPLSDAVTWAQGHEYCFRLRPSTYMQAAMLAEEAAKLPAKRWALVAPNYEYGQSAVKWFKELLQKAKPDVQFVAEQFPALGRIDAGATVQALAQSNPDAIYNVTFGPDLTNFVRQGNTRGLFEKRSVVSLLTGEPEYLDPLKDETPEGWIVTGYPWEQIDMPVHTKFRDAYRKKFNDYPRLGSVVGYEAFKSIAAAIAKAGSTDTDKLVAASKGLKVEGVFGPYHFRPVDHQSTLGAFVGKTALKGGKGVMVDWRYADGAKYLPPDDVVKQMRPA